MRINFNFGQPSHSLFHVNGANSVRNQNRTAVSRLGNDRNRDRVTISPQGKMMNMIENLTKQKEKIAEQKSKLVTKTLESGKDIKTIETQLDFYAEQLENIDKQISKITADMAKQSIEKQDEKKSEKADEEKTAEELEAEKFGLLTAAAEDVKQAKVVSSVKEKVDGDIRVEKQEIETNVRKIEDLKTKGLQTGANVKDVIKHISNTIDKQEGRVSDLRAQADNLSKSSGKKLSDASGNLDEAGQAPKDSENAENPEDAENFEKAEA